MCGICGFVSPYAEKQVEAGVLNHMTSLLKHRGPDDEGFYFSDRVGLGIRRLSIIDLETGNQPIFNEDGSLSLVFNGEIYNYPQLREELKQAGHRFRTKSDGEVLLHAFEQDGFDSLKKLNGMFAYAIWDRDRRRLFIARDRLGIKPLYYWIEGDQLAFASELRALIAYPDVPRTVDPTALDHYLTLEYIPAPFSILSGVRKLPAGHFLVYQDGELEVNRYWDLAQVEPRPDPAQPVDQLRGLLEDAVRLQMISDVPLGAFLSGGIDSSTVVACMASQSGDPIRTFSIGFAEETYNELPFAREIAGAFQTRHRESVLTPEIGDYTVDLVTHLSEPLGDFSIFPTYWVSRLAAEEVKVVLSGDGGDEVFGGYETYLADRVDRFYRLLPGALRSGAVPSILRRIHPRPEKKGLINKIKRFAEGGALSPDLQHTRWMIFLTDQLRRELFQPGFRERIPEDSTGALLRSYFDRVKDREPLTQQQYVDMVTYLPENILTKVDRMSMAVSLETRVPLLDHRIVEYVWSLPSTWKINGFSTKVILRKAMGGTLPSPVIHKQKQGFSIPIKHWLRGPLRGLMLEALSPDRLRIEGIFNPETVQGLVKEHLSGRSNYSHQIWALVVYQVWKDSIQKVPKSPPPSTHPIKLTAEIGE